MNQIRPLVYLSGEPSPRDVPGIVAAGVKHVLDLRGEPYANELPEPELWAGTPVMYHYIPMLDRGNTALMTDVAKQQFAQGVAIIRAAVARNEKILVHCAGGISRGPSMVYAYLRAGGMSAGDAATLIHNARSVATGQYYRAADAALPQIETYREIVPMGQVTSPAMDRVLLVAGIGLAAYAIYKLFVAAPSPRRAVA